MARFADTARRLHFGHKRESRDDIIGCYESMFHFQSECERSAGAFQKDWENIEELYTQADLLRLACLPNESKSNQLCKNIAWVIWDVYRRCIPLSRESNPMQYFGMVPKCVTDTRHLRTTIITTNYDLLAESQLANVGVKFTYPGFAFHGTTSTSRFQFVPAIMDQTPDVTHVEVIKLHGSVNWFIVGDTWHCSRMTVNTEALNSVASTQVRRDLVISEANKIDTSVDPSRIHPALIPPMLGKASLASVISCQWRSAITALSRARCVIVIGYSFPETDTFMTRLLAEGLHNNDDLERVMIVDIGSPDLWRAKLNRMMQPVFLSKKLSFLPLSAAEAVHRLASKDCRDILTAALF